MAEQKGAMRALATARLCLTKQEGAGVWLPLLLEFRQLGASRELTYRYFLAFKYNKKA